MCVCSIFEYSNMEGDVQRCFPELVCGNAIGGTFCGGAAGRAACGWCAGWRWSAASKDGPQPAIPSCCRSARSRALCGILGATVESALRAFVCYKRPAAAAPRARPLPGTVTQTAAQHASVWALRLPLGAARRALAAAVAPSGGCRREEPGALVPGANSRRPTVAVIRFRLQRPCPSIR